MYRYATMLIITGCDLRHARCFISGHLCYYYFPFLHGHDLTDIALTSRYTEDMELDDAIHTAILTLKEG